MSRTIAISYPFKIAPIKVNMVRSPAFGFHLGNMIGKSTLTEELFKAAMRERMSGPLFCWVDEAFLPSLDELLAAERERLGILR